MGARLPARTLLTVQTLSGDLGRRPLSAAALDHALRAAGTSWRDIRLLDETGSTNLDATAAARDGAPEGLVVLAEHQSAGRGRRERTWTAPRAAGLTFSVLLRPVDVPAGRWSWISLAAGVAVAAALTRDAGVASRLKWPNDVQAADGRKLAGILAERVAADTGSAVVLGIGINVTLRAEELPVPEATSLLLAGATVLDRAAVLAAVLRELERWYGRWRAAHGDPEACGLRAAYAQACATIGRQVRVHLPDGRFLDGAAREIDDDGSLVVARGDGDVAVAAGDVVHVR